MKTLHALLMPAIVLMSLAVLGGCQVDGDMDTENDRSMTPDRGGQSEQYREDRRVRRILSEADRFPELATQALAG